MSAHAILAAAIVITVVLIATCAIVEVRRWWDRVNAERAAAVRRIEEVHREVRSGVRHGARFTLDPANPPRGKAPHVSSTSERSENRG